MKRALSLNKYKYRVIAQTLSVIFETVKYIPQNFLRLGLRTVQTGYGDSLPFCVLHSEVFFNVLCLTNPALVKGMALASTSFVVFLMFPVLWATASVVPDCLHL